MEKDFLCFPPPPSFIVKNNAEISTRMRISGRERDESVENIFYGIFGCDESKNES